jgi:hypothetical protein
LNLLELALREVSSNCELTLPYWAWTLDAANPSASPVWQIVGGNGVGSSQCINSGPFTGFSPCIRRQWNPAYPIPSLAQVASVLSGTSFSTVVAQIESLHGSVHMFVGGQMTSMGSPYDPIFFLHHAYIDKLWDDWQKPVSAGGFGNGNTYPAALLNIPMSPFGVSPADVLSIGQQLCTEYAVAGTAAPCGDAPYVSVGSYQYGYDNGYNRDGYSSTGYTKGGYSRYFLDAKGQYDVTRKFDANGYDSNGFDKSGYGIDGLDQYGYSSTYVNSIGCGGSYGGPFYVGNVYGFETGVYGAYGGGYSNGLNITRLCPPIRPPTTTYSQSMWIVTGTSAIRNAYATSVYSYESQVSTYGSSSYGPLTYPFCFDTSIIIKNPVNPCPYGLPLVRCIRNPCEGATCAGRPNAKCVPNYCGGCYTKWYENNVEVQCGVRDECSVKCADARALCARNKACGVSLAAIDAVILKLGQCDAACLAANAPKVYDSTVAALYQAVVDCYTKCRGVSYGDPYVPVCELPVAPGPCKAAFQRWYYSMAEGKCVQFVYGGCFGNANNFATQAECENRCDIGACCMRNSTIPVGSSYGTDKDGYNSLGYAYVNGSYVRPDGYVVGYGAPVSDGNGFYATGRDSAGYDANGVDYRLYDKAGYHSVTGFNVYGVDRNGKSDGLNSVYSVNNLYDKNGYDRSGMNTYGIDKNGYNYGGVYVGGVTYSCSVMTRSQCQAQEKLSGIDVIGYSQGKNCSSVRCIPEPPADPRTCTFAGSVYKYGETFRFGCEECVCSTNGKVVCKCSKKRVRKEIRDLSTSEAQAFTNAVVQLKSSGKWDTFVNIHLAATSVAHGNPNFWCFFILFFILFLFFYFFFFLV